MNLRNLAIWGVIILGVMAVYAAVSRPGGIAAAPGAKAAAERPSEMSYSDLLKARDDGNIVKVEVRGETVKATLRDTATPTMLRAGYKANVVPATAEAVLDCRVLPGRRAAFLAEVDRLLGPDVSREWVTDLPPYETAFDGDLVDAMTAALLACDPDARPVPYMLSGGTDAKAFAQLGIRCFGFIPLRLPPELDFAALFHGVDERVPVDALKFGTQVLEYFLTHC